MVNMSRTLPQWLDYLESLNPQVIDLGLQRVAEVVDRLQCRRPAPLTIIVAGTNGKGTSSALLAALLRTQGLTVGVYSSPHLRYYNERVGIDGEWISDEDLIASFERVEQARGDLALTYFEFGTVSALEFFARQSLDVCVLEIGLGGRLDAVNVAEADVTLVTSIGLDHQAWLGDTVEQIAYEKCAIARAGVPLVCGQPLPPSTAKETVLQVQGQWYGRGEAFDIERNNDGYRLRFDDQGQERYWHLPIPNIPYHNVATAIQALALVQRLPPLDVCQHVVAELTVNGRLQRYLLDDQQWLLDVAHNPQAMAHLQSQLPEVDGVVFSALADKPVAELLASLPAHKQLLLTGLDVYRGLSVEQLLELAGDAGRAAKCFDTIADAMAYARQQGGRNWLVAGSFYTVEQALNWLDEQAHGATS